MWGGHTARPGGEDQARPQPPARSAGQAPVRTKIRITVTATALTAMPVPSAATQVKAKSRRNCFAVTFTGNSSPVDSDRVVGTQGKVSEEKWRSDGSVTRIPFFPPRAGYIARHGKNRGDRRGRRRH